jgi:hypothetical protein
MLKQNPGAVWNELNSAPNINRRGGVYFIHVPNRAFRQDFDAQ